MKLRELVASRSTVQEIDVQRHSFNEKENHIGQKLAYHEVEKES